MLGIWGGQGTFFSALTKTSEGKIVTGDGAVCVGKCYFEYQAFTLGKRGQAIAHFLLLFTPTLLLLFSLWLLLHNCIPHAGGMKGWSSGHNNGSSGNGLLGKIIATVA